MTPEIREACYERIRTCMKDGVAAYYKTHPDRLGDRRSEDAIRESLVGLKCIFEVLDEFHLIPVDHPKMVKPVEAEPTKLLESLKDGAGPKPKP